MVETGRREGEKNKGDERRKSRRDIRREEGRGLRGEREGKEEKET